MFSSSFQQSIQTSQHAGDKIVCVFGNFNVLHPGHLRFLKFAADLGDKLFVGLFARDHSAGAFLPDGERLEALQSVTFVDDIFIVEDNLLPCIQVIEPAYVVKGKEFEKLENEEEDVITRYGGKLVFGSGEHVSAKTLDDVDSLPSSTLNLSYKALAYCNRHQLTPELLNQTINGFKQLKIAVIGDVIVDEYVDCQPLGMSQEDPTIVVSPQNCKKYVGGAGIVSAHARGLGAEVDFYSVVGNDNQADFVEQQLEKYQVSPQLYRDESRPTTTKKRYRANNKSLLRVNDFRQHDINAQLRTDILSKLLPKLSQYQLIVFSDFNYGLLCNGFLETLISEAKSLGIPMVADSQSSSQLGDLAKFHDMLLVTPTEHEARLTLHNAKDGLIQLSEKLGNSFNSQNVMVTLAEDGILLRSKNEQAKWWDTDELPAFNPNPVDVAGAGDAMLIATSMALVSGANIWQAAFIGSVAAGCQVGRVGNIPLKQEDLFNVFAQVNH